MRDLLSKNAAVEQREPLTQRQFNLVHDYKDTHRMGLYAFFLLYTGARRGEGLGISWKDIDFNEKTIHIHKTVVFDEKGQPYFSQKLKNGLKARIVPMFDPLYFALIKYKKTDGKNRSLLFTDVGDKLYTKSRITSQWRTYQHAIDEPIIQHQFRHTYAMMLYESGVDPAVMQDFLGHKTLSQTMNVYTHCSKLHKRKGLQLAQKYFSENPSN